MHSSIPCAQPSGAESPRKHTPTAIPTCTSSASFLADSCPETSESSTTTNATRTFNQCDQSTKPSPMLAKTDNSPTLVQSPPGGLSAHLRKLSLWPDQQMRASTCAPAWTLGSRSNMQNDSANLRSPTQPGQSTRYTKRSWPGSARAYNNKRCRKTPVPSSWGLAASANLPGPREWHQSLPCGCRISTRYERSGPGFTSQSSSTTCASHTCLCKLRYTWWTG